MKKSYLLLSLGILFIVSLWLLGGRAREGRDFAVPFFQGTRLLKNFFTTKRNLIERIKELERRNQELSSAPDAAKALVLSQSPTTPYDTLLVGAGREEGIEPGFKAVAYGELFLGEVLESGDRTSLVKLISFPELQSEGWLERLSLNVNLEGRGGANLHFFLPKSVGVEVGDRVLSNTRPVFLISQVEYIKEKPGEPLVEILLRLPLNLRNLRYVELIP